VRSNRHHCIGRTSGSFTLIEVLVALVILALGVVTLLQLQLSALRNADRAFRQSQAVLLAGRKMAETLSAGYPAVGSDQGTTGEEDPGGELNWSVTVADLTSAELQGTLLSGLRSVRVEVSWPEGQQMRTVQLVNYVGERSSSAQPAQ